MSDAVKFPTPQEMRTKVATADEAAVLALSTKVRDALTRDWTPGKSVTVDVTGVALRVRREVEAQLTAVGWHVTSGDDQRDGAWLTVDA